MTSLVGVADVSAHRLDEYLQAARLAIDPGRVQVELDLTPGIALAEEISAAIDRNRDGSLSEDEQWAYGRVVSALTLDVDGTPVAARLDACRFPGAAAIRQGEGTIRLHATATLPPLSVGDGHLIVLRHQGIGEIHTAIPMVAVAEPQVMLPPPCCWRS